jgi:hypothetical protein
MRELKFREAEIWRQLNLVFIKSSDPDHSTAVERLNLEIHVLMTWVLAVVGKVLM